MLPIFFFLTVMGLTGTTDFDTICEYKFLQPLIKIFLYGCITLGILFFIYWIYRKLTSTLPAAVVETETQWLNLKNEIDKDLLHGKMARSIGNLPFNECLKLTLNRMTFEFEIPADLDGLKICHISDLHYTGQIGIEYFKRIVEEANRFEPDLIFITGDLVDERCCLSWLEPTLGKLIAKHGTYYVLGNHDKRIRDEPSYRQQLEEIGLIKAAGHWRKITINESKILLTGNELPWYKDANDVGEAPNEDFDLRILLSHSPDQLGWARPRKFDLMFAGHTHGGQIAFPFIGPIVAPSKYGVRYASGTFQIDDMVMHVSRGISGDEPIRLCSPPELGLFTIQSTRKSDHAEQSTADQTGEPIVQT